MVVIKLNNEDEFPKVLEEHKDKLLVCDFYADWCGPCKMIAPQIEALSEDEQYKDSVVFIKVNVDELSDIAEEQGVQAMPTFFMYKNKEKVGELVGANKDKLIEKIKSLK